MLLSNYHLGRVLATVERWVKGPLWGCRMCGSRSGFDPDVVGIAAYVRRGQIPGWARAQDSAEILLRGSRIADGIGTALSSDP